MSFEQFIKDFFQIFSNSNFFENKNYLEYIAIPQTNDEDNIVDTKIILPLLSALGYESGDIAKNITNSGKDRSRPDFQVYLGSENIRCFLVEDKNTAYDITRPEPLMQLVAYAPMRGYDSGLICNGRLLLGYDLTDQNSPQLILSLNIEEIIKTYLIHNLSVSALTNQQFQDLKGLYRRFHRNNFDGIENLVIDLGKPEAEWLNKTISLANNPNFDELLIQDIKKAINFLEEDVLYQLEIFLKEYEQFINSEYYPNGKERKTNNNGQINLYLNQDETASQLLERLRKEILNYLRAYGVLQVEDYAWATEKLINYTEDPKGTYQILEKEFLQRLQIAENQKKEQNKNDNISDITIVQLDLIPDLPQVKKQELGIQNKVTTKITHLHPKLIDLLKKYQEIVYRWRAWEAEENLTHAQAIKTRQHFMSWTNLITQTVFQNSEETVLEVEFARQTAYVYVIRLLMVRICEDKKLISRKFSNGGFKYWKEEVEPRYLDLARGMSMDYLLELSYRSAQSVYAHFFKSSDLFNWYRISSNILIRVLHILNRFNLQEIDSDIIGMVYGRYVEEGKHEQGRYFTPKPVVNYILDQMGYTSENLAIRDKKLLDLAGGSGSFLVHAARRLINSYRSKKTGEIPIEYVPVIIEKVKNSFFCLDINPFACYLAETNLLIQVIDLLKRVQEIDKLIDCSIDRFNVYNTDSLFVRDLQQFNTPLLNPLYRLELSIIEQIKTKTGRFSDGFDFVVGNPPYVRADEPGVEVYRQTIDEQKRFNTLYEKWDLFVPFVELATKLVKENGKIGLIVSRGIQSNNYAEILRNYIADNLTILQVDFFNNVKIFSDAVVNNTIFFLENKVLENTHQTQRFLHSDSFDNIEQLPSLNQQEYKANVFRQFVVNQTWENTIDLEDICYCTKAMVLHSEDKEFKKDDLISDAEDNIHSKKYVDGENIIREFAVNKIRYLEWNTARVPSKISRATIPELYDFSKILFGMTSFPTYDRGNKKGDGFYVPDSVRICVRWDDVYKVKRLKSESRQMYEISKKRQRLLGDEAGKKIQIYEYAKNKINLAKQFDLRYIIAILASTFGKRFLLLNNRDENIMTTNTQNNTAKSRIYPDDLKEFPIKNISKGEQKPYITKVDKLVKLNWEIYEYNQQGHEIKFNYNLEPTINIDFLVIFNQLNFECWDFIDAEDQLFEIVGDRTLPITKIKVKDNHIVNGRDKLIYTESELVLQFLSKYLPQFEKRGFNYISLLNIAKIPKTDDSLALLFQESNQLETQIKSIIQSIRETYQELDQMVNKLYLD